VELGIFSRTYRARGTDDLFACIARDGFVTTQFNFSSAGLPSLPKEFPESLITSVLDDAARSGVTICALSGTYNMAHPDADQRRADRAGFANVVRAARSMQVPLVTLCTGTRDATNMWSAHPDNASADAWAALREELEFALDLAERHDVTLGVEPEPGNVVADARKARQLLDEIGSPRLGIVMDAANLLPPGARTRQREIVSEAVSLLGADLALVHTKDVGPDGEAVAAGRGIVDFRGFLQAIASTGYLGPLVSHNFPEEDATHVSGYLGRVLAELT
jgi:sugar phosphate isomerase/epimerase